MHILEQKAVHAGTALLSRKEMAHALELMFGRMDAIDSRCADGFPLYSREAANQWVISPGGSWVGGFWGGCWWLRSRITACASDLRKASDICQRLSQKISVDSVNRSLIFWYGAALGNMWFDDTRAGELMKESIAAIAASYDPDMHCIPLGTGMGGGRGGNQRITIDTLATLIQLLNRSEQEIYRHISRCHADTLLAACRTDSGAFHGGAHFSDGSFKPINRAGTWSRGQAWAMLGLTQAAARWGEPYLTHARSACEYWRRSRPESLPPDRLSHPSGRCDPSSSVIASLAMLFLAELAPDTDQWRACAHQQLTSVIRSRYFTGLHGNNGQDEDGTASGIFWGCCYEISEGKNELVESAWGSYFLMAARCVLLDAVQPCHC